MVTRGCPHNCGYCCNNLLRDIYEHQSFFRKRSADHVVQELVSMRTQMPFIGSVWIVDDTVFALRATEIGRFAELYGSQVGLPFGAFCSPATLSEEKLKYLVDAGLVRIGMGIQSGSERTLRLYNRRIGREQVLDAARIINKFKDRIAAPRYDIIVDSPWETMDDKLDTLELLQQLPRPFRVTLFSLTLYPGTQLYDKARVEGLIDDERKEVLEKNYWFTGASYYNLVQYFYAVLPRWLMGILTDRRLVLLLSHPLLNPVYRLVARIRDKLRRLILVRSAQKVQRT